MPTHSSWNPCKTCGKTMGMAPCKDKWHIRCYGILIENAKKSQNKARIQVIQILGGACINCGNRDVRVLQVNHKNGGGTKDFKKVGAKKIYSEIVSGKRDKKDYDVRCANCNILYEYEMGRRL